MNFNGKHGQGTHSTKMGAGKSAESTPNAPKFQKFGISMKKGLHWASVVHGWMTWSTFEKSESAFKTKLKPNLNWIV